MILQLGLSLFRENFKKFSLSLLAVVLCGFLIALEVSSFESLKGSSSAFLKEIEKGDFWICFDGSDNLTEKVHNTLSKVKGLKGVADSSPLYRIKATWQQKGGKQEECIVIGVDPSSELGLPLNSDESQIRALKNEKTLLVENKMFKGVKTPVQSKKYQVHFSEGVMEIGGTFQGNGGGTPRFYTSIAGTECLKEGNRKESAFILIKAKNASHIAHLRDEIETITGFSTHTVREVADVLFKADLFESSTKEQMRLLIGFSLLFIGFVLTILFTHISKAWKKDLACFKSNGARFWHIGLLSFFEMMTLSTIASALSLAIYWSCTHFWNFCPPISPFGAFSIWGFLSSISLVSSLYPLFSVKEIYQEVI